MTRAFREKTGVETRYVRFGSTGEALNQIRLEKSKTRADILVGVDGAFLAKAWKAEAFSKLNTDLFKGIASDLHFDSRGYFVPFDYGYLAILFDSRRTKAPEKGMGFKAFASDARRSMPRPYVSAYALSA